MRNKKLLQLQSAAESAFGTLTEYLRHLDARETDSEYIHARMLFEEGWRYNVLKRIVQNDPPYETYHLLWYDATEDADPEYVAAKRKLAEEVLKVLGLIQEPGTLTEEAEGKFEMLMILKDKAVKNAEYEEAAKLRDQAQTLKTESESLVAIDPESYVKYESLIDYLIEITDEVGEIVPPNILDLAKNLPLSDVRLDRV